MPSPTLPRRAPSASFSRRAFIAFAAAAATTTALGPVAPCAPNPQTRTCPGFSVRQAYADPSRRSATLERVLGATRCALDELKAHENDSFYLSTSFGNTGPNGAGGDIGSWDCWYPNGRPKSNGQAYMNCAGFVVAVLEACGANCDAVGSYVGSSGYNRGNKSNLSRWVMYLNDHADLRTRYESKEAMLASGALQKGDLIIADPRDWSVPGADCHVLFFWGDSPSHDRAWHSSNHAEGVLAGTCPGNMISKISAKSSNVYWLHVPLQNAVKLALEKRSADISIANGSEGPHYSLENARFSIFGKCEQGVCSDFITQFVTDAQGHAEVELPPNTDVWIREDAPPLGFCAWTAPMKLHVGAEASSETLLDEPQTIRVLVEKTDAENGATPQGHATLEGAQFELVDSKGNSYKAETRKKDDGRWIAEFPEIARGNVKLREIRAPRGYVLTPLPNADDQGWVELSAPQTQEARCEALPVQSRDFVARGDIEGVKTYEKENDDASTRPALEGAVFRIWLQDDGTIEKKGYRVETIADAFGQPVLDESGNALKGARLGDVTSAKDGRFTTKDLLDDWNEDEHNGQKRPDYALPFGTYAILEMHCPDPALRLADPIVGIEVHAQSQTVFFTIEDRLIHSPVRIRKTDSSTGKTVLASGTVIELLRRNESGAWHVVEFDVRTPESARIARFTIPESGIVQFPEKLAWGSYAVREISTIAPYVVRKEPIEFDVGKNHDWDESDIIEIELPNDQATGIIEGLKTDELTNGGVAGATYTVRAADDIVSPDGTACLHAGDIAGTAQSDENGAWRVGDLPLGAGEAAYIVAESESPEGYIAEKDEHRVVLTWENDSQRVVFAQLEIIEKPTRLRLRKVDAESGEPISHVEFRLSAHKPKFDFGEAEQPSDETEGHDVPEASAEENGQPHAHEEARDASDMVPESVALTTDEDGFAEASHLARGFVYEIEETLPRYDLGYVAANASMTRYLAENGLWYESEKAWKQLEELGEPGDEVWDCAVKNDFTRMKFYKVDAEQYRKARNEDAENGSAEAAAAQAHLNGGLFRLEDDDGQAIAPSNAGLEAKGWPAQGANPVEFDHLQPNQTYWLVEACAPQGYSTEIQRSKITMGDTAEPLIVVLENDKNQTMVNTSDALFPIVAGTAGLALAGSIAAIAAYTARRKENSRIALEQQEALRD